MTHWQFSPKILLCFMLSVTLCLWMYISDIHLVSDPYKAKKQMQSSANKMREIISKNIKYDYCDDISKHVYVAHLIQGDIDSIYDLLDGEFAFLTFANKSMHHILVYLNWRITANESAGKRDFLITNEVYNHTLLNILYLYYPSTLPNSWTVGRNYLVNRTIQYEESVLRCRFHYFAMFDDDIRFQLVHPSHGLEVRNKSLYFRKYYEYEFKKYVLGYYEPAIAFFHFTDSRIKLDRLYCVWKYKLCSAQTHDEINVFHHREFIDNRVINSHFGYYDTYDNLSWHAAAVIKQLLTGIMYKSHILSYLGIRIQNSKRRPYPRAEQQKAEYRDLFDDLQRWLLNTIVYTQLPKDRKYIFDACFNKSKCSWGNGNGDVCLKELKRFKHFGKPMRKLISLYQPYGVPPFQIRYDQFDWNAIDADFADNVCQELIVSNIGFVF